MAPQSPIFGDAERLIRRVYAYVAGQIGPGADAEDVTSATFERALRYEGSFDPRRGTPVMWLIGIARHELADHRASRAAAAEAPDAAAPGDVAEAVEARLTVWDGARRLPPETRELLALHYAADLSARQIGELLGMRTNAVEVALHRARASLRAALEGRRPGGIEPRSLAQRVDGPGDRPASS